MNSIRERREALGMTQPLLAAKLRDVDPRIDVGMVSRFETDLCLPTEDVLEALEAILQADRSDLYPALTLAVIPKDGDGVSASTRTLARVIPTGRASAIERDSLAAVMDMTDRQMRRAVALARREGLVICNLQDGSGYYQPEDVADLRRQLESTHRRAMSLLAQEKHLRRRIREEG